MIPAEAVEAAARVMYEHKDIETTFGDVARKALEAAAPYLLATHKPEPNGREIAFIDISKCRVGERVELNGRTGTVTMVDTVLPDMSAGMPVVLVNWDDQQVTP